MAKRILLLQGSPRPDGNSADLAHMFKFGAEDAGHIVSMPEINGKNISGCLSCNKCRNNGGFCVIHDYMYRLYEEFARAEAIVMVTPIYFFALPAQIKAILDRCYCYGPDYPLKKLVLILTSNDEDADVFSPMIDYYNHLVKYFGWDPAGMLLVNNLKGKGDVKLRPEFQQAYLMGQHI